MLVAVDTDLLWYFDIVLLGFGWLIGMIGPTVFSMLKNLWFRVGFLWCVDQRPDWMDQYDYFHALDVEPMWYNFRCSLSLWEWTSEKPGPTLCWTTNASYPESIYFATNNVDKCCFIFDNFWHPWFKAFPSHSAWTKCKFLCMAWMESKEQYLLFPSLRLIR